MARKGKLALALIGVCAITFLASGCEKLKARDNLNRGVQAYRNAKYSEAVEFFKKSVDLDPNFTVARLYLATAYMSQYIPGADSPENAQMAKAAEDNFHKVLDQNKNEGKPEDKLAVASLASLHYSQAQGIPTLEAKLKKLDEAREWYEKLTQVDPQNKEAYYSLGVIVWAKWYPRLMEARAKMGMRPEDPGPLKDKKIREELKTQWSGTIEDGLKNLEKALAIDPQYDDAMAYMNLLIRERADLADSSDAYKKDVEVADNWVQKTMETKKIKAAKQPALGGIVQEQK
jgi:tetratricopeptide (TPR) repeat protein